MIDVEEDHIDDSCNTKKIVITNSHDLHKVEHLTGPDIKVIELTHPLYPKNSGEEYRDDDEDGDGDDDDEYEDSDSESISSDLDGPH